MQLNRQDAKNAKIKAESFATEIQLNRRGDEKAEIRGQKDERRNINLAAGN
jgi:hypothetical protein